MASYGERFAEAVRDYLVQNKLFNGDGEPSLGRLNGKILGELSDRFEQAEVRRGKAEKAKRLGKGERDKLFETLAVATGCDPKSMTEAETKRCAVAISAIIRATPDVKPSEVEEACRKYGQKFTGATITPTAISNNWSKLFESAGRGKNERKAPEAIPEPDDWRAMMRDDEEDSRWSDTPWGQIMPYYQNRIAKKCARIKAGRD